MQRSTCKLLMFIGIFILILTILFNLPFIPLLIITGTLIIIALTKWNSEEEHKDLRDAQIKALNKGKVNVELKGKMRKLR